MTPPTHRTIVALFTVAAALLISWPPCNMLINHSWTCSKQTSREFRFQTGKDYAMIIEGLRTGKDAGNRTGPPIVIAHRLTPELRRQLTTTPQT